MGGHGATGERSLALTPTWSVATVLTAFVIVTVIMERSIHRVTHALHQNKRRPLLAAVEKMKEELMLLGFMSLFLTAASGLLSNICIPSKYYDSKFVPCSKSDAEHETHGHSSGEHDHHLLRRMLSGAEMNNCQEGQDPFVSFHTLEQLHHFIFVMAVTHISFSCFTMLLAIVKIRGWKVWEEQTHKDHHDVLKEIEKEGTAQMESTFVRYHTSTHLTRHSFVIWMICFFRQLGHSVSRSDYLTLRNGFISTHHLPLKYDFHSYMIRSMEEEFQEIVGVSNPLWCYVVAFMLFNVKGFNLYFWMAIIPFVLVLLVGVKLQHVMAILALEHAEVTGYAEHKSMMKPRDDLFWFRKPEILLHLIHFILFQNAFEYASFLWFWWQFGYDSCFLDNHSLLHIRLVLGFIGQFLCSYSTLPTYALVAQMGTNYKATIIPERIRETMQGWQKATRKKRRHAYPDDSTTHHSLINRRLLGINSSRAVGLQFRSTSTLASTSEDLGGSVHRSSSMPPDTIEHKSMSAQNKNKK